MEISSYLTEARIKAIEEKLDALARDFKKSRIQDPDLYLIDHSEFIQMFRISLKTSKNWRDKGLPYAQINGKIYFRISDLKNFVKENSLHLKSVNNPQKPQL